MVVTRTLAGLLYAWRLQEKCILLEPFHFHKLSKEYEGIDFSEFNVQNIDQFVSHLLTIMNITSLLLHYGNIETLRIEDKTIITKGNGRVQLDCDFEFFEEKETGSFEVFDEFYWRSGLSHNVDVINSRENFCKQIIFHESEREGVVNSRDFTVFSKMTIEELLNADYGNGIVRIKVQRKFKDNGLKGIYAFTRGDKVYHKAIKFEFANRVIIPILKKKKSLKEVFAMEQKEGKEWKKWKKLIVKRAHWSE